MPANNFSRSDPFTAFGGKIDPLREIRNAGIITNGDVYWVSNEGDSEHRSRIDSLGRGVVKTSIQNAIDASVTDQNDYVMVIPRNDNATWAQGTALDVNKDRLHVLSAGYGANTHGYTNTIEYNMGTTPDTELIAVSGNGVELAGFRVLGTLGTNAGGTMSNALVWLSANSTWVHDCEIEANHAAGTPPLVASPGTVHGARFDNVRFVTLTDSPENGQVVPGNGSKRWEWHNCRFEMDSLATSDNFVQAGTGATEYWLFDRCSFINVEAGTAVASAIVGSVTVDNPVLFEYCTAVNTTGLGTDPGVFVAPVASGTAATVYDPALAVGTAAVAAS